MKKRSEMQQIGSTDEEIIQMYWQREEKAIQETHNKYGKFLFRMAYNILQDRCDSEECQNDTYLGIWNAIPPTKPVVFPAFITKIMRGIALNRYKEKTAQKRIPSELTVSIEELHITLQSDRSVEEDYTAKELGRWISDYIGGLSEKQRFIFIGRFYVCETLESIASDLSVSVSSVHREIDKMKQGLKSYLEGKGVYNL